MRAYTHVCVCVCVCVRPACLAHSQFHHVMEFDCELESQTSFISHLTDVMPADVPPASGTHSHRGGRLPLSEYLAQRLMRVMAGNIEHS